MKKLQFLILGLISLALAGSVYADVELVKDGKPMADIVVPEKPLSSVKLAAEDIQKYLELMSGTKLQIVAAPSENVKSHIYVGESELTKKLGVTTEDLKVEGFKIIAKDNYIVLVGHDDQRKPFPYKWYGEDVKKWQEFAGEKYGVPIAQPFNGRLGIFPDDGTATLYASSEFLEQLGVRWYNPYENGTIIPDRKSIVVPEQVLKKEPKFPIRQTCFYWTMASDHEGLIWFKRLKYGSSYSYKITHSFNEIIGNQDQRDAHPEYFAVANGKQLGRKIGVPRLCDESLRKSAVNFLNKTFEAYPQLGVFNLMPTDGFTEIDERDAKIWNRPERGYKGKFSDYVWDFWLFAAKELKKSHPDKYLLCSSYAPYEEVPSQVEMLPDNVAIDLTQNTAVLFMPQEKPLLKLRAKWLSILPSKKMFMGDYYLFYRDEQCPRYPVFFTKLLQEDMQSLAGICEGKFIETAPEQKRDRLACPGLVHMLHYWQGKLYWDPDMDRQKMLDEYYDLYFGPARKEMKEFYEFAEEVWMRPESRSITMTSGFLKEKDVDRYFEILKRAREKAGQDTVYDKRVAQIEGEMEPLKKQFANLKRTGPTFDGCVTKLPVIIDGDLSKPFWMGEKYGRWYTMGDLVTGQEPDKNRTQVSFRMTPDKSALVIGIICDENKMVQLRAKTRDNDDFDIFNDDAVEVYIETPERSYFKIVVNPEGKIWDETQDPTLVTRDTLPTLWNPGTKAAVKKEKNRWTVEILIPTKDFGLLGPNKAYPWGINVCRARLAGDSPEAFAISPTGQMHFCVLSKLGNLVVE